jgi:hypothetical protein
MSKSYTGGQTALATIEKKLSGSTPDDSVIPASVRRAARLMLAGGAVTFVIAVFWVIVAIADRNAFTDSNGKKISGAQFSGNVAEIFVTSLLPVLLWVLMARYNRAGAKWARIVASVLAAIATWDAYQLVNSLHAGQTLTVLAVIYIVVDLVTWVIGVIAIALLWRGEATAYYNAQSARR